MERTWADELGRSWTLELELPDTPSDLETGRGEDVVLVFSREGGEARSLIVLGPAESSLEEWNDSTLRHCLEAASAGVGLLLVEEEGSAWWVHQADAEARVGEGAVRFSDGEEEYLHPGPLPDGLDRVSEDELLEMLDEARGRLMDPLDLRV
jgi:hypothetical protein